MNKWFMGRRECGVMEKSNVRKRGEGERRFDAVGRERFFVL
jgi:hypothetical protein